MLSLNAHLAKNIWVGVVLQENSSGARVVISCSDVQCGEADLALGAVVDEQCHHVFVALLEGDSKGSEAILREGTVSRRETEKREKREEEVN